MEFAYRFRPVSRLIGPEGVGGELDELYIFFAAPEQLNDPLEGYKDVFFRGDSIVWENLVRHYVRCLINEVFLFLSRNLDEAPSRDVGVFANSQNCTSHFNELHEKAYNRLIDEPILLKYIQQCLAGKRKMRRWELINHLSTLHPYALEEVFIAMHAEQLLPEVPEYLTAHRGARLAQTQKLVEKMSTAVDDEIYAELFKSVYRISEQYKIITRLGAADHEEKESWFHLLFEFPECYCLSLDRLIHPAWYTACFMASCSDSSIWGTYGGNHRDVCLKFKIDQDEDGRSLNLRSPSGCGMEGIIHRKERVPLYDVCYEKEFIEIDFFQSLGHLSRKQLMDTWYQGRDGTISLCAEEMLKDPELWRKKYWEEFYHATTVKLKAWNREQESRLILSSTINDLSDPDVRKLKYDFNSLDGIIFGINTSTSDKVKIIKKIKELCALHKRADFNFYQASYDQGQRSISYDRMAFIKAGCSAVEDEKR
ncbi:TPA: DUF2971 domain-containing protein [Pseudomonas putida]|uniref:hypothetical protein n=1 Tax=Pseudomonas putida TaxID=303 RepID=UPI0023643D7C|nr:hypothetical protein [Pseudomonas putida]MDD2150086.1 hypothetical protein [Pseudomonas putida]HDS1682376.1 DUF2971 domain-containing protein [Pseudomonas putida]